MIYSMVKKLLLPAIRAELKAERDRIAKEETREYLDLMDSGIIVDVTELKRRLLQKAEEIVKKNLR